MKIKYIFIISILSFLTGCAHSISIKPDEKIVSENSSLNDKREYNVGYYISSEDKKLEVTTLGGGGDNVRYYPYSDIEDGYKAMLSHVFKSVTMLSAIDKNSTQLRNKIDFIITPKIITTSGGSGFFTWPPTNFTVDLTNTISTIDGDIISEPRVIGSGGASTSEKISEHGIAGRRAVEDALTKTQVALSNVKLQRNIELAPQPNSEKSISGRLKNLKGLKDLGLISDEDFAMKKQEILKSL